MNVTNDAKSTFQFLCEPFHCDFQNRLQWTVLGNHILNSAGVHAGQRGFGIRALNELQFTWVLSRLAIEMDAMPMQADGFRITTWIENVYRFFTDRNFVIADAKGMPIGYARSVWAMIDWTTRRPVDLLQYRQGHIASYICHDTVPIAKPGHIKVDSDRVADEHVVRYSDIDLNGHVNSIKYVEHVLDLFSPAHYAQHPLHRVEVAYVAESNYGDRLQLVCNEGEADRQDILIRKGQHTPVAQCRLVFHAPRG